MSINWSTRLPRDVGVIVVAGGTGTRFGDGVLPKQYHRILDIPVLEWAVTPFLKHPEIAQVVVVLPAGDVAIPEQYLPNLMNRDISFVAGGVTRTDSVRAGAAALRLESNVVLIHDGARPILSPALIDRVIARVRTGVSTIPALPLTDTVKRVDQTNRVIVTVAREGLYRVQTPQAFPRGILARALAHAGEHSEATDDAMLVEAIGEPVQLVAGDPDNLKVTVREDLELAAWKLSKS